MISKKGSADFEMIHEVIDSARAPRTSARKGDGFGFGDGNWRIATRFRIRVAELRAPST